jgi:hypothetical protein
VAGLADGWHTIGLDWTEKEYVFYVDGKGTWRTDKGVSGAPQELGSALKIQNSVAAAILYFKG